MPLTPRGEQQAKALAPIVGESPFGLVLVSPAQRATRTADLAGLTSYEVDPDLWEWDYGGYEGVSTPDIRKERPGWYLWRDGVIPGATPGESAAEVGARADRVIARAARAQGRVALVAHGHLLRVLTARWLRLDPADGRLFRLDTGTYSRLAYEHGEPVIRTWNAPVPG